MLKPYKRVGFYFPMLGTCVTTRENVKDVIKRTGRRK